MQLKIEDLKTKSSFNSHLKEAYTLLKKKFEENELALEEIGKQLQEYVCLLFSVTIIYCVCLLVQNWKSNLSKNIMDTLKKPHGRKIVKQQSANNVIVNLHLLEEK